MRNRKLLLSMLALAGVLWGSGVVGTAYAQDQTRDQILEQDRDRLQDQDRVRDRLHEQDRDNTGEQVRQQTRTQAREQDRIYGSQMMTRQERMEYQQKMRNMKTNQERETFRREHHERMKVRAKERGLNLPDEPPERGRGGMGGFDSGMGGSMGGGGMGGRR